MGKTKEQREAIMEYVIYCIYCKNTSIQDCYVGSTDNINRRMSEHKYYCNNENSDKYNQKIYKIIRDNGGWEDWEYTILEVLDCNEMEARQREGYYQRNYECVNIRVEGRTPAEYYQDNKKDIKEKKRIYKENHKQEIKENAKVYKENHKQEIKQYYQSKKAEIKQIYQKNKNNPEWIFNQQRNHTINRLKKGLSVRQSTLDKYNINRQDYINE